MERVGGKRDCVGKGEDMVENGEAMGETRLREKRRGYRGKYRGYGVNEILWEERRGCVKKGEDWGGKGRRRKREEEEKVWGRRKEFGRKGALLAHARCRSSYVRTGNHSLYQKCQSKAT